MKIDESVKNKKGGERMKRVGLVIGFVEVLVVMVGFNFSAFALGGFWNPVDSGQGTLPAIPIGKITIDDAIPASVYNEAKEDLTNIFASDEVDRVNFVATSVQAALDKVNVAVDTILNNNPAGDAGDFKNYAWIAGEVVNGLNDVLQANDHVRCLGCPRSIEIKTAEDAALLGELIAETAKIVDSANSLVKGASSPRGTAENIFSDIRVNELSDTSVLQQLLDGVRKIAQKPESELIGYVDAL